MARIKTWRFIDTGECNGHYNMAVDEALMQVYSESEKPTPVLRFYGWALPTLSLGRFQKASEVLKLDHCKNDNQTFVRRMTGGGCIYHTDEITYSLVCTDQDLETKSVKESYHKLCAFLIMTYRKLGLKANYALDHVMSFNPEEKGKLGEKTAFCFAGKELYDIVIDGKKLGGNAQRRKQNLIMQHGSIPLGLHFETSNKYLTEPVIGLDHKIGSLRTLGVKQNIDEIKKIMAFSFAKNLNIEFISDSFTEKEKERINFLLTHKYQTDLWNLDGKEN